MPKRSLTAAFIAEAALRLGDRDGQAAMSMRRIAAELGCDPMAIYRHFPNREALLDAVADLALAGVTVPPPSVSWDDRVREILTSVRAEALRHPGIAAHVSARPPLGPHGLRLAAELNRALAESGLSPTGVVHAGQALIAYVAAALAMAVNAGVRDERWHRVSRALTGLPGEELPVVGSPEQFRYGLRLMINGIRAEPDRD
ncbi:TetR/AcrR family transcriptional regulator [Actinoplanes aureus]|uniref:TetR family transcriptional regulator n=1 Tax=Actinoplanes aureus TaxID=2792083 RepID=A0A931FZW4_9ACTN|nr:TetR/AcrR family transcriptional regulator [Actinoplanes aureus]MBG0565182.1 TetR family transcriptional regulator [Actinoplanes aureus]